MEYTIKRIGLRSALRVGLALGWLVALFPSLALAGLAVVALRRVSAALGQIAPYDLSLLGQNIARFDLLQMFGLAGFAQAVGRLSGSPWPTFVGLAAILTLAGAAIFVVVALVFSLCYNLLAATLGGLKLELREVAK